MRHPQRGGISFSGTDSKLVVSNSKVFARSSYKNRTNNYASSIKVAGQGLDVVITNNYLEKDHLSQMVPAAYTYNIQIDSSTSNVKIQNNIINEPHHTLVKAPFETLVTNNHSVTSNTSFLGEVFLLNTTTGDPVSYTHLTLPTNREV